MTALRSPAFWLRLLFWGALLFAVVMALLPHPPRTPLDPFGDKVEHAAAFGFLSVLGSAGYARMPLFRLGERLSFLGALIEVTQSIPALHRDCDILDWLTDTLAIAVVLVIVAVVRSKRAKAALRLYPHGAPLNAH
jgi:hypothetical protein